jgi:hypothetical protein
MLTQQEHEGAKDALKWAARTYVVAALGLSTLLYYVSIYMGGGQKRLKNLFPRWIEAVSFYE